MDKKEIRRRSKEKLPDMGIYQIKNLVSGKIFIGRAMDLNGKLNSERFQLKNGMHMNRELQMDFNSLGEAAFAFEVLDRLRPKAGAGPDPGQELKELEALWLDKLRPAGDSGYHKK